MRKNRPAAELRRSVDKDGVVEIELRQGGRIFWISTFGLLAAAALAGVFLLGRGSSKDRAAHSHETNVSSPGAASNTKSKNGEPRPAPKFVIRPKGTRDDHRSPSVIAPGLPVAADEPPPEQNKNEPVAEERTGINVFPPPGTKKLKRGIVVPDDFELPPGYMRHFQTTDKGQMLSGILVYHPDYEIVDESGKPVPFPEDRVVPADMAPPGLPLDMLEIPEDAYADPEAERAAALADGGVPIDEDPEEDSPDDTQ
jgi:hypothetical protein